MTLRTINALHIQANGYCRGDGCLSQSIGRRTGADLGAISKSTGFGLSLFAYGNTSKVHCPTVAKAISTLQTFWWFCTAQIQTQWRLDEAMQPRLNIENKKCNRPDETIEGFASHKKTLFIIYLLRKFPCGFWIVFCKVPRRVLTTSPEYWPFSKIQTLRLVFSANSCSKLQNGNNLV